ncbi:hypothetical protein AcV5_006789 [Taiwanofungus camphoratus]|nr:hypothetical protein AcV5_006789 [Antrodia cinnamomea]
MLSVSGAAPRLRVNAASRPSLSLLPTLPTLPAPQSSQPSTGACADTRRCFPIAAFQEEGGPAAPASERSAHCAERRAKTEGRSARNEERRTKRKERTAETQRREMKPSPPSHRAPHPHTACARSFSQGVTQAPGSAANSARAGEGGTARWSSFDVEVDSETPPAPATALTLAVRGRGAGHEDDDVGPRRYRSRKCD